MGIYDFKLHQQHSLQRTILLVGPALGLPHYRQSRARAAAYTHCMQKKVKHLLRPARSTQYLLRMVCHFWPNSRTLEGQQRHAFIFLLLRKQSDSKLVLLRNYNYSQIKQVKSSKNLRFIFTFNIVCFPLQLIKNVLN